MLQGVYEVIGEKTKSGLFKNTGYCSIVTFKATNLKKPVDLFRKVNHLKHFYLIYFQHVIEKKRISGNTSITAETSS